MSTDPFIIRTNITHYRAMLKLDMDEKKRAIIERLLAKTEEDLLSATEADIQQQRRA